MEFQSALASWYRENGRSLPWRKSPEQYSVWVSEIMAQQTTIAAVLPYFDRWMKRFPTVESLADADLDEVFVYWQGLGYYQRARNFHQAAQLISQQGWPHSFHEWLAIPGVGRYTAAAISSICNGESVAVVDGNVERVFSRIATSCDTGNSLKVTAQKWADSVLDLSSPGDWNQAVMELGAIICRPKNPNCEACPVSRWCESFKTGQVHRYPYPKAKKEYVKLTHHIWIPTFQSKVGIRVVPERRWWAGMYEFPREEELAVLERMLPGTPVAVAEFSHVVTKHKIQVFVSTIELKNQNSMLKWVNREELQNFAMAAPSRKAFLLSS